MPWYTGPPSFGSSMMARRLVCGSPASARERRVRRQRVVSLASIAQSRAGRRSAVHSTTSSRTGPAPCSWTMSVPLNLSVEASSADAARSSASTRASARRIRMLAEDLAARVVQAHERAAHRRAFEQEARDAVGEARRVISRHRVGSFERHRVQRHRQRRSSGRTSRRRRCPPWRSPPRLRSSAYSACIAPSANSRPEPTAQNRLYSNTSRIE